MFKICVASFTAAVSAAKDEDENDNENDGFGGAGGRDDNDDTDGDEDPTNFKFFLDVSEDAFIKACYGVLHLE
jgi:hypothetical protein